MSPSLTQPVTHKLPEPSDRGGRPCQREPTDGHSCEQRRHLLELFEAGLDQKFFQDRRRAGLFNENYGISPSFYLGLYTFAINRICDLLRQEAEDEASALETEKALRKAAAWVLKRGSVTVTLRIHRNAAASTGALSGRRRWFCMRRLKRP